MTEQETQPKSEAPPEASETSQTAEPVDADLMAQAQAIADKIIADPSLMTQILTPPKEVIPKPQAPALVETKAVVITPEMSRRIEQFKYGTAIPMVGKLHAFYVFKYDIRDKKHEKIVWDVILSPLSSEEALTKWPLLYRTPFGDVNDSGYLPWYNTVGHTSDYVNNRDVPIKMLMMTPSFAFRGVDVKGMTELISEEDIMKATEAVEGVRTLILVEETRTAKKVAKSYKGALDRVFKVDIAESAQDMADKSSRSTDKGDTAMEHAFKVKKDWKKTIKDNWCWIAIGVAILIGLAISALTGGH